MKILYAVQATGNGHVSRAREIVPLLKELGETDVLLSGQNTALSLPFEITYRVKGLGFAFGKRGGIDYWQSIRQANPIRLYKDIKSIPVENYDVVISDFEPVSAWACKMKKVTCSALSHQAAFLSKKTPRIARKDYLTEAIFKYYSPSTLAYGFHFKSYDDFIYTPVIRKDIRSLQPSDKGYYIVYLPAYDDQYLAGMFHKFPEVQVKIFSIRCKQFNKNRNVEIIPVNPIDFTKGFEACTGIITGGGFETPAEAIYLNKKILCVPMLNQYEQQCNAEALRQLGITVIPKVDENFPQVLMKWFENDFRYHELYPDITMTILEQVIARHLNPEISLFADT